MKKLLFVLLLLSASRVFAQSPVSPTGPIPLTPYLDNVNKVWWYDQRTLTWYPMAGTGGGSDTVSFQKFQFKNTGTVTNAHIALDAKDTTGVDSVLAMHNNRLYRVLAGGGQNLGNSDLTQSDPTRTFTIGNGLLQFIGTDGINTGTYQFAPDQTELDVLNSVSESTLLLGTNATLSATDVSTGNSGNTGAGSGNGASAFLSFQHAGTGNQTSINIDSTGLVIHDANHHFGATGDELFTVSGSPNQYVQFGNVPGGSVAWGAITGTLSSQTDLQTALNAKQATLISGTNLKTVNSTSLLASGNLLLQTPLTAGTDYLAPTGSAAGLTGLTSTQVTTALGFTPVTDARTLTINGTAFDLSANRSWTVGDALVASPLSQFAATTSAQLAGVLSDETGTGLSVFATSPSLTTPLLGVATATSINKVAITAPATSATLTIANGATLQQTGAFTLNLTTTANSTPTFPTGIGTLGYLGSNNTWTGAQNVQNLTSTSLANNIYIPSASISSSTTTASYLFAGASTVFLRFGLAGTGATTLTTGTSYANVDMGSSVITTFGSGTHALITGTVMKPVTITSGGATVTDATPFISYPATGATGNWNGWMKGGITRVSELRVDTLTASKVVFTDASKNITSTGIGTSSQYIAGDGSLGTIGSKPHTIFTPTTGGTVTLINNQYNIINPAGALLALTVTLPSSPANNDCVFIKFTQNVTTVTYGNGTVVDGITAPTAGGLTVLTYDSGTTSWY